MALSTTVFTNISQLVTVATESGRNTGIAMNNIGVIDNAVMIAGEKVEWIGTAEEYHTVKDELHTRFTNYNTLDIGGKCVIPGFVDSHTHVVFAGNRSGEFARRLQGVSYQQIASEGGGILSTMRAVRNATVDELYETGKALALSAMRYGTTSMEIKSGYGLSLDAELNQLRAIKRLKEELPLRITATFLGAHDFPPEYADNRDGYVDTVINEMLPRVADEQLAVYCDVFCDTGYYTLEQSQRILESAAALGLRVKVHADELSAFGAAGLAASLGAVSADHLLFVSDTDIDALKEAGTVAALLPGTAYTLRLPYAPARRMIESGATVALATDCNPGSCFMENMQQVLSLACMNMKMSIEEAITAATLHGAAALNMNASCGSLTKGYNADFLVLDTPHYADLVYHFGVNHVEQVWIDGVRRV
ncbi:MAG: imidazolonepropionase [Candidatus Kapabacteria bacterium]|nr:imidazolonepropionase [Candidatus Kapabacteria bacterium]